MEFESTGNSLLSEHTCRHNIGSEDKPIGLTILSPMDQVRYQLQVRYMRIQHN